MTRPTPPVLITPGLSERPARRPDTGGKADRALARRSRVVAGAVGVVAAAIGGQLLSLASKGLAIETVARSQPIAESFARPDIVDRNGRLLATDVRMPSLYADPARILDRDVVVEKLKTVLPELDEAALRRRLADRSRRFVWVRRGLSPIIAQHVHNLGLPGLGFKQELRRAYPAGGRIGHVLGATDIDNKGLSGIERYIDTEIGVDPVPSARLSDGRPVRLSLDLGVQHAVEDELQKARKRYHAKAAAGVVLDVATGEVLASASLPGINPIENRVFSDQERRDRTLAGTYELGSVFKVLTAALALDTGVVTPGSKLDVTKPLVDGWHTISDKHGAGRPLTVAEVLIRSSNVGAGLMALAVGPDRQRRFLDALGLLSPLKTEAGETPMPQVPQRWQRIEQITIGFGHGLAVAPLQFASAAGAAMNGGVYVPPTFLAGGRSRDGVGRRVLSAETSRIVNTLLRLNVTDPKGTGRRADVDGYLVGGKTGTAEIAAAGGYQESRVITSFVSGFPMPSPKYLVLVSLFEPKGVPETKGRIAASRNAAPVTAAIVKRIGPVLNVAPAQSLAGLSE